MDDDWVSRLEAVTAEVLGERATWNDPLALAQALDPVHVARPHLTYLARRLALATKDVEAGRSRFLAVSMPPRTGKSSLTSVHLPLWVLNKHPGWDTMLLSHDPSLATTWGRQVRRAVEEHGPTLDLQLSRDAGAAGAWEVHRPSLDALGRPGSGRTEVGSVLSRSIRESVTGRGAKVLILDDIVKDFAAAHSKTEREFVWDWWKANSRTRLHAPALVVAIGTRWHEDDFIGRLLSDEHEGDPGQWEVISFPALAEHPEDINPVTKAPYGPDPLGRAPGEPLLSPLVPRQTVAEALEFWADIRRDVGSYAWAALYQQRPEPAEGAIFNNDWWGFWADGDLPRDEQGRFAFDRLLTSWDCAFKKTEDSDYVVGQLWGTSGPRRYLLRQVRRRMSFTETLAEMETFVEDCREWSRDEEGVHEHIVEDKANGTAVIDTLRERIPGMIPVNPTESKEARARAVSPVVEAGDVLLPSGWAGLPDFLSEHKGFPNGTNDDQVDCTTQALRRLRGSSATEVHVPVASVTRGYGRPAAAGARGRAVGGGTRRRT